MVGRVTCSRHEGPDRRPTKPDFRRPRTGCPSQRGLTLIELLLAVAIGAILLAGLNDLVKLGLEAQAEGRRGNELAYQARFALERIGDAARASTPRELATPTAGTSGDWFAPILYCRNASRQLIETTTADTGCAGATVIADEVDAFSATLPADAGPVDRSGGVISLSLSDGGTTISLSSAVRLGGGTK